MSQAGQDPVVPLGNCQFDPSRRLLLRNGAPVPLRPKAFALLAQLAAHPGRVIDKSDLIAAVWPGIFVTEDSLTQAVRELRKALADEGQRIIRTVARRGYLLHASQSAGESPASEPVVAVLRFANRGEASLEPIVDGFTEDVINGLARFRRVTVLARSSSFSYGPEAEADWRSVGGRLGATFLVTGAMDFREGFVEARVRLIDAGSGMVLWGEAFLAGETGIFALQHDIAPKILNRLVTRLDDASLSRAATKAPASLAAYEMCLRGVARLRSYRPEDNLAAKRFFEEALARDPDYALAHAFLALTDFIIGGYEAAPPSAMEAAIDRANLAVTLAPEEPRCHRVLALARLWSRAHEAAEYHLRRSLELNPDDADTTAQMGYLLTMRGRPLEALKWLDRAVRMNPIHPDWYHCDRGMALYAAGDYRGAVESLSRLPPKSPWRLTRLAACHAQLGNLGEARRLMAEVRRIAPEYSPLNCARQCLAFEHASDTEHLVEGVEKAFLA